MSDPTQTTDRTSTAAIVTYVVLGQFFAVLVGVFALIAAGVKVDPVMLGVLGGLITATVASVSAVVGYWVGASAGGKTANAALAQIAAQP